MSFDITARRERPEGAYSLRVPSGLRRRLGRVLWLAAPLCLGVTAAARAQVAGQPATSDTLRLTLAQARARGLAANPDLLVARLDTAIARGYLRQARAPRFNPSADILSPGGATGAEFGVTQELEVFGQRGRRMSAGRAAVGRASAGVLNTARLTIGDIDRAFYRLASVTQRTALANEVLALNLRLASVAQGQLEAGEISRLDYNFAVVELGRSRSRALATNREREQVELDLLRLLGLPAGTHILADMGDLGGEGVRDSLAAAAAPHSHAAQAARMSVDSLVRLATARRPDLTERSAAIEQARAEAALARREALPNLIVRGVVEPGASGGQVIRPGIGATLPIFNRNRGIVEAREAGARQAELERSSLLVRLRTEIAAEVSAYRSAAAEVEILETTVLAPARQNRQLLETAYREGKVGLPVLLLIRNQVIDAELEYWASWLAERIALADLAEATGENISQPPNTP